MQGAVGSNPIIRSGQQGAFEGETKISWGRLTVQWGRSTPRDASKRRKTRRRRAPTFADEMERRVHGGPAACKAVASAIRFDSWALHSGKNDAGWRRLYPRANRPRVNVPGRSWVLSSMAEPRILNPSMRVRFSQDPQCRRSSLVEHAPFKRTGAGSIPVDGKGRRIDGCKPPARSAGVAKRQGSGLPPRQRGFDSLYPL